MSKAGCDYLADLTTTPIFDDAVYLSEALGAIEGQNEDSFDAQLAMAACVSGIEDPYRVLCPDLRSLSTALSTMTVASEPRSSMSIHSHETQSTGFTSQPSRTSRDLPFMDAAPALRTPPPPFAPMRGSTSLDYCDTISTRSRPSFRHSPSSSAFSSNSLATSNSSLSRPAPRKHKRASGFFSMFKRDQSTRPSQPHHGHYSNPLNPKLECGHSLSKHAIRVQEALDNQEHVAPSCCVTPLPTPALEIVFTKQEMDQFFVEKVESPSPGSICDSGYSEDGISPVELGVIDTPFVAVPSVDSSPQDEERLGLALTDEAFVTLRAEQKEQFQRVSSFESNQRTALSAYHQSTLSRLSQELERNKAEKTKQHASELERLDESQIIAEHDLRNAHAQEAQNVATAIKYMEAYCSSAPGLANSELSHTITEDDRKHLARQHVIRQKLPAKHDSAINVLRARQEKDTKTKLQKQRLELQQLGLNYENEKTSQEWQYMQDSTRLNALIEARRARINHRWDLKYEIWRKEWEKQHETSLNGRLPHEEWPESIETGARINASSSLALYIQVMA